MEMTETNHHAVLTGLLGVAERVMELTSYLMVPAAVPEIAPELGFSEQQEPTRPGLYRDRDGDIWQRNEVGWRLCVQQGVALDVASIWNWMDGHVREYAPFTPLAVN